MKDGSSQSGQPNCNCQPTRESHEPSEFRKRSRTECIHVSHPRSRCPPGDKLVIGAPEALSADEFHLRRDTNRCRSSRKRYLVFVAKACAIEPIRPFAVPFWSSVGGTICTVRIREIAEPGSTLRGINLQLMNGFRHLAGGACVLELRTINCGVTAISSGPGLPSMACMRVLAAICPISPRG